MDTTAKDSAALLRRKPDRIPGPHGFPTPRRERTQRKIDRHQFPNLHTQLLEQAHDAVIAVDRDFRILYCNPAAQRQYGILAEEAVGKVLTDLYTYHFARPEDEQAAFAQLATDGIWRGENIHVCRDGTSLFVESTVGILHDAHGNPAGYLATIRDITDRKRTEEALRRSEEQLSRIYDSVHEGIILLAVEPDRGFRVLSINRRALQIIGRPEREFVGRRLEDAFPPEQRAFMLQTYDEAVRTGQAVFWEETTDHPRGRRRIEGRVTPLLSPEGPVVQLCVTLRDITEQKNAEDALRASERELRHLFASMKDYVFVLNGAGRYLKASSHSNSDRKINLTLHEHFPPEIADRFLATIRAVLSTHETAALEYSLPLAGEERWFSTIVSRLGHDSVLWVARDITERKNAEHLLRESEERFRLAFEAAQIGNWDWNIQKKEIGLSECLERILGITPGSVQGRLERFLDVVHPDDRDRVARAITTGSEFRSRSNVEFRFLRPDGSIRWAAARGNAVRDREGTPLRMMGVIIDTTERRMAEEALRRSETRFRQLAAAAPGVIFTLISDQARHLRYEYLNPAFEEIHEIGIEEALKEPSLVFDQIHPEDRASYQQAVEESIATMQPFRHEWRILTASGKTKWLQATCRPEPREDGEIAWYGVALDITESKRVQDRFQNVAANMPGIIYQYSVRPDGQMQMLYVSPGARDLWELEPQTIMDDIMAIGRLIDPHDLIRMNESLAASAKSLQPWNMDYRITTPSGREKWLRAAARPQRLDNGDIVWDGVVLDVTDRKRDQELIAHNALHDPLTDLPNRTLLLERLDLAIQRARRIDTYGFAVLFLDLDRFKVINDSLGHLAGDYLLKSATRKLLSHLRGVDLVARLGGDEFVILLEDINTVEDVVGIAERILADFTRPVVLNDVEMVVTTSIGIVMGTDAYKQATDLLRNADIALYRAKAQGGNSYKIFDEEMHEQAVNRLSLENYLRKALEHEAFFVYYQPVVDIRAGRLVGFEVLARMYHPTRGFVTPTEFLPIAEETGLIVPLDRLILQTACQQLARWKQQYPDRFPLRLSVNLSGLDLRNKALFDDIDRTLRETGLTGSDLALEITESTLIENIGNATELLSQLKERGIQISIDDFGTGYSSLSYLHQLPADSLKIDRSFVGQMQQGNRNYQIVSTIVALSDQLGLSAVAEGIETRQQLDYLRQLGCEFGQGYLFSKPLSVEEVDTLFSTERDRRICPPALALAA